MSAAEMSCTIFVGNIPLFCTEANLFQHFASCGAIVEIRLAKSEDNNKHLSYGFIRFGNALCAQLAIQTLNGSILCGRPLK
jgi:RNA recognition motif-containing protein